MSPVSASNYRDMVNAVADSVHAVDPSNIVVAGGLDPFGHKKSKKQKWYSVAPLAFMRSLLCLSKGSHPHSTCSDQIRFEVWSHHPYSFGGPFGHAKLPDNVELGDLPKMRALLKAGVRLHHIVSAQPLQFWATEFGWNTKPPRTRGVSLSLASRWTAESLHQMWLSGISLVTWFLLQDYASPSTFDSGLFFHSSSVETARAKPVRTAFRFPFVSYLKKKRVSIWGRVATSDKQVVTVQRRHGKKRRVADGGARPVEPVRDLQGDSQAEGDEEGLAPRRRQWLRQVAGLLAHCAARPQDRALWVTRPPGPRAASVAAVIVAVVLFWGSLAALAWTHALYPATVALAARVSTHKRVALDPEYLPSVAVIVTAYNEEELDRAAAREPSRARLSAGAARARRHV